MRNFRIAKTEDWKVTTIFVYLIVLSLFGCGNTLVEMKNTVEIINKNSVTLRTREFKLTKLKDRVSFDQLPKELASYQTQIGQFDFYLAQASTQSSGGS